MTLRAMAEKLRSGCPHDNETCCACFDAILSEALAEAVKEDRRQHNERVDSVVREIRAAAYEEAAKIASDEAASVRSEIVSFTRYAEMEESMAHCLEQLAATIRLRAEELK